MSSFTEEPVFSLTSKRHIKNRKAFSFYYKEEGGEKLDIAEGYECDGGTIPRFAWCLFPPVDYYVKAFFIHDYMYEHAVKTKKIADKTMLKALLILGVPKWQSYLFYYCVRLFGRGSY